MSYSQFGYSYTSSSPLLQMSSQHSPTSCCESGRPIMTDPHTGQTVCSCQVDSRLLSYPRLATGLPVGSIYGSAYSDQGYVSFGADPSAFYSPLNNSYDLKDGSPAAWSSLTQAAAYYSYDPTMAAYPYSNGYGGVDLNGAARRKNATKEVTSTLKAWLYEHRKNPYPTKGEKIMLAIITKMTLTQVSTWFANARRRLKKENKMTWEPRNRVDDDDKSDVENDNDPKDCSDSGPKDNKYKVSVGDNHKLHDLCDKTQDSDDLLHKNCSKDDLDDLDADSRSSSPASPLSLSSQTGLSQSSLGGLSDPSPSPDLSSIKTEQGGSSKPRIWSLAHTATSNSPPSCRKSPQPPSLHGLAGNPHMSQSHVGPHPAASLAATRGMTMGGMVTSHQTAAASNLASRPDLRTWIEGAFHGASALTAMGIAAQYHGLVSSANSLGVHSTQTNNVCMGNGGTAAANAITTQGPSMDRVSAVGTMGPIAAANHGGSSIVPGSTHVASMNTSRPSVVTTSLDTNGQPNPASAGLSCRLPPTGNAGHKVGLGFPNACNTMNAIGQTSLFASVKSGLCSLSGDRVGLHTGLTNVNRTTSQTEVLNTAFRPVTKT